MSGIESVPSPVMVQTPNSLEDYKQLGLYKVEIPCYHPQSLLPSGKPKYPIKRIQDEHINAEGWTEFKLMNLEINHKNLSPCKPDCRMQALNSTSLGAHGMHNGPTDGSWKIPNPVPDLVIMPGEGPQGPQLECAIKTGLQMEYAIKTGATRYGNYKYY
ncbi:hypothetical protein BT96DRAFT_1004122 [Gymnopus androsaceus JB14]|uniref:Uncharacterized protein n=1 Tax=Gymnopus androsaceus JB14 TaxID=1447944 RepID=A0A6A4GTM7_9AGAR|nr:hypothetical protein BT96DRAFT_1004122 [Gymnopus androsaceus JB14]